jgi:DNA-binding transcriptional LysR family regulator
MAWSDFEFFLAVARGGSHAAAARALHVDPTTVGRRLTVLQEALGTQLFERRVGGLRLTEAGSQLVPRAERMEAEAFGAERELRGADARLTGEVRVTAPDGIVVHVLLPRLHELRRVHPGLEIEVRAEMRTADLARREADIAVRLARPKEPSLVARRAGTMRFALYASHDYLAARGTPRKVADLAAHDFIAFDIGVALPQIQWLQKQVPNARYVLRLNNTTTVTAACAAGHGITLLPTFVAADDPRLTALLPRITGPTRELWVVTHQAVRRNARVTVMTEWLGRVLAI